MARFAPQSTLLHFVSFCIAVLFASVAQAQISNVTNGTSTPIPGAGHDYIKMLSETVNPANGSVSIRVQVPTPSGRGMSLPFSFAYDSNGAAHVQSFGNGQAAWWDNTAYLAISGWSYSVPMLSNQMVTVPSVPHGNCVYYQDYVFQDATGGRHSLLLSDIAVPSLCQSVQGNSPIQVNIGGDDYYHASLGSGGPSGPPLRIADLDGTVYTFPHMGQVHNRGLGNTSSSLASSIEDRNGNTVTVTDLGPPLGSGAAGSFTMTDTLGRTLVSSSGFGTSGNTVVVAGLSNPYSVTWGTANFNFSVNAWLVGNLENECAPQFPSASGTRNVITQITLPNGQSYQFSYDSTYGMVNKITYPTGGYVSYSFGANGRSEAADFEDTVGDTNACYWQHDVPAVAHRYVSFDGTHVALQQDFTYSTTWSSDVKSWSTKTTSVKTTDLVTGAISNTSYTYNPISAPSQPNDNSKFASQIPLEQTVVYKNSAGTALRTVTKGWYDQYEIQSEQTLLNDSSSNPTSLTTYTYSPNGALVTQKLDYDYGPGAPGALLRKTVTNYQSFATTPIYPTAASIFDKPCQTIVYDGSNNRNAETDYFYDGGTTLCGTAPTPALSGTGSYTGHDETLYGTTATVPRGNLTQRVSWANSGASPATTYAYDETGQVLTVLDPCGNATCSDMTGSNHTTTYSYSDSYTTLSGGSNVTYTPAVNTNAYLTTITDPLGHTANFTYDFYNGQLTISKDANLQSTTVIYNDPFARPMQINYPDGGQIEHAYNDTPLSPSVTTCQLISGTAGATCSPTSPPSGWKTSVAVMDGLGHAVQGQLASDPDGITYSATSYDGFGRTYQSWNPTRCSPPTTNCGTETTWGFTTNTYDPLGRPTQVTEQDGSTVQTAYDQTCTANTNIPSTTVTDEAGQQRSSCTDGLGRLTFVFEAPNQTGYNYETDYVYDPLGNLQSVSQKGSNSANARTRSFQYDSLSRLTTATNPESGQISYAYDANGNLSAKTAPLPNQTVSSTVTTNYAYDVLNRLSGKTYKDGTVTDPYTPPVLYGYDGVALSGCTKAPPVLTDTNPIGRRTSMCDGSGATSWDHDSMGRIMQDDRFIGSVTPGKFVNYGYTLDGSLQYVTTPPLKTIAYTYGGAGRALQSIDSTDGINFVTSAKYAPPGGLTAMTMGSASGFTGIVTANAYNDRLQPILLSAASPSGTVFSECFDFHLGVAVNTAPCSFSASTAGDNGNVNQIVNNRDNTRTENYTYDPLNRIASGYSSGTQWGETFTIDSWGNLTNEAGITGKTLHEGLNTSAGTNNRLAGFGYDAAGNMTSNGSTSYVYDAENRLIWTSGYRYLYDGNGERVEKCVAATATTACPTSGTNGTLYWRGTGTDPLDESDLSGNALEEYVFFNGQRVARRDVATNNIHYYFSDHLGSHGVIENATGTICEQDIDYYPYGGVEHDYCGNAAQNYKFTGKERDSESGLDHFGARHHASALGRFMSVDPKMISKQRAFDPQQWNMYSYTRNSPLTFVDPDGKELKLASGMSKADQSRVTKALVEVYRKPGGAARIEHLAASDMKFVIGTGPLYGEGYGKTEPSGQKGHDTGKIDRSSVTVTITLDFAQSDKDEIDHEMGKRKDAPPRR